MTNAAVNLTNVAQRTRGLAITRTKSASLN